MNIVINKTSIGWVAGIFLSIGIIWTGIATAIDEFTDYHDSRWVTIAGLNELFNDRDLKILKDNIKEYEWIKNNGGGLTDKQEWELGEMYDDLEEATE
jgi:hypothetical protein